MAENGKRRQRPKREDPLGYNNARRRDKAAIRLALALYQLEKVDALVNSLMVHRLTETDKRLMAANIAEAHHQTSKQILEAAVLLKEMDSSIDTGKLRQIIEERSGNISVDDLLAGEF